MQMDDPAAAGALVQVVHVLRDDRHLVEHLLQACHEPMAQAGLHVHQLAAAFVVEFGH